MFKKTLLTSMLLLPACCFSWGSGLYVGAGVGADSVNFNQNAHVTRIGSFNVVNNTQLASQGVFGTLFGGYALTHGMYYLATELNGNLSSAKFETSNFERLHLTYAKTTYKINNSWGVSLLPGIELLSETALIYGRVGYSGGHFEIRTTDLSLANASKRLNGVRFGFGMEKRLYQNLAMRVEYNHIDYKHHSEFVYDPVGGVAKTTRVTPNSNQFEFGFDYWFC